MTSAKKKKIEPADGNTTVSQKMPTLKEHLEMIDYIIKNKGFLQYLEENKILSDEDMKQLKQLIEAVSEIRK